jgi:hypothetical protein
MSISLSAETKELLKKIQSHLASAEELFAAINDVDNHKIYEHHTEGHSLNHCIRWGAVACDDLVE